jgi:hypothetical protein
MAMGSILRLSFANTVTLPIKRMRSALDALRNHPGLTPVSFDQLLHPRHCLHSNGRMAMGSILRLSFANSIALALPFMRSALDEVCRRFWSSAHANAQLLHSRNLVSGTGGLAARQVL